MVGGQVRQIAGPLTSPLGGEDRPRLSEAKRGRPDTKRRLFLLPVVVWLVVVRFVIVGFDQAGRTGLIHRHSTTGLAVIATAISPGGAPSPADVGGNRPHPLQWAHAAGEQVPKGRPRRRRQRSPLPLAIAHSAILLLNSSCAWPVGRIHSGRHLTCTIKTPACHRVEGGGSTGES